MAPGPNVDVLDLLLCGVGRVEDILREVSAYCVPNQAGLLGQGVAFNIDISGNEDVCTDPDCVPVETVLFLTATGWNVSTKVLKDPVEVSKPDIEASMGELCRSGRARAVAHRARAGVSVSGAAETDVSKQADLNFSEK